MGYGISYNDKGIKEYEGYWCNDLRYGYGKSFDNEGNVIFEGNWYNGNHDDEYDGDGNDLNITIKRLKLNDKCILNDFDISLFLNLEELIIGNNCFSNVNVFNIDGLNHLKSVKIGSNSFTKKKNDQGYSRKLNIKFRSFSIVNCDKLESIEIGSYSFSDYGGGFELKNLPKLSTIKIGDNCFCSVNEYIDGLFHLQLREIEINSFTKNNDDDSSRSFVILDCDELKSIDIGSYSFSNYGGLFELRNLPKLSIIKIGEIGNDSCNFYYSSFVVKGAIV